jgi:Mrp family chromosome partitioning ATPase
VTVVAVGDTPEHAIDELAHRRGPVNVVRRCPELAELLAACQSGLATVALVAGPADALTATLVDRLTAVGVSVVAVAAGPDEMARLRGIGAFPVAGEATAEALTDAVLAAVNARKFPNPAGFAVPSEQSGEHRTFDAGSAGTVGPSPGKSPAGKGKREKVADAEPAPGPWKGLRRRRAGAAGVHPTIPADGAGTAPESETAETFEPAPPGHGPAGSPGKKAATPSVQALTNVRAWGQETGVPFRRPAGDAGPSAGPAVLSRWPLLRGRTTRGVNRGPGVSTTPSSSARPRTMAVWGPVGSPGRTTVAVNLAAELAAQNRSVMLIDADSYGASIAAALGLLEESASFAQACRVADQGLLTPAELARISTEVVFGGGTFSLLTGLTRPDRWPELRAAAVERVVQTARSLAEVVIIDCGFSLENDEELSYDTVAPRRNAATLAVLGLADVIYAVGGSDAIGIPRLIRALAELPESCAGADLRIVLNKVRRKAVGPTPEKALEQAWERFGPSQPIGHFLPWDADLTDKALLEGRLLQEIAPDSPLRRAIMELCCAPVQRNQKSAVPNATATAGNPG